MAVRLRRWSPPQSSSSCGDGVSSPHRYCYCCKDTTGSRMQQPSRNQFFFFCSLHSKGLTEFVSLPFEAVTTAGVNRRGRQLVLGSTTAAAASFAAGTVGGFRREELWQFAVAAARRLCRSDGHRGAAKRIPPAPAWQSNPDASREFQFFFSFNPGNLV